MISSNCDYAARRPRDSVVPLSRRPEQWVNAAAGKFGIFFSMTRDAGAAFALCSFRRARASQCVVCRSSLHKTLNWRKFFTRKSGNWFAREVSAYCQIGTQQRVWGRKLSASFTEIVPATSDAGVDARSTWRACRTP